MPKNLNDILKQVRKYGHWKNSVDADQKINHLRNEVLINYSDNIDNFETNLDQARQARDILDKCYKLGRFGKKSDTANEIAAEQKWHYNKGIKNNFEILQNKLKKIGFDFLTDKAKSQVELGQKARERYNQEKARVKNGKNVKTVTPQWEKAYEKHLLSKIPLDIKTPPLNQGTLLHANDIRALSPCEKWTLLLDETGGDFEPSAQTRSDKKPQMGRMVALLLPDDHTLPDLNAGWHAVNENLDEIDRVVQEVLGGKCGVFGISVKSIHPSPGERWAQLAKTVIDWVVRLLPLNEPTNVDVLIEQRGTYHGGQNWKLMVDIIKHDLANSFPERAKNIGLDIQTIGKTSHQCNGYVDAVAFTWAQSTPASSIRLHNSAWDGTCLLSVDPDRLLQNWHAYCFGQNIDVLSWEMLISSDDAMSQVSLVSSLLTLIGEECHADSDLWGKYLDHSKNHATGKAVDLRTLAKQINWLERFRPVEAEIPAPLRLVWLTVKLARSNHLGETEVSWLQELSSVSGKLYQEDAPLVCHADLHLAVQETNRFAFDRASVPLKRWKKSDPAIPGLRYWGQVQSSLGQHAAFLGDPAKGVKLFDKAIGAFKELSSGGAGDCRQTGTYKLIAMMDDENIQDREITTEMEKLLEGMDWNQAIIQSCSPKGKYLHHLLLRYLVFRGNKDVEEYYLSQQDLWKCEHGHPWPLIQAYRALLLYPIDKEKALEIMIDGAGLAFGAMQGPTVQVIGACIRAIAHAWGKPWTEAEEILNDLGKTLPEAKDRLGIIRNYINDPPNRISERDLLTAVLPFNFR